MTRNTESKVESRLDRMVRAIGGITRKWTSPSHVGVPDRIVINRITVAEMIEKLKKMPPDAPFADIYLTEVKTDTGKLSSPQIREHARLRDHGAEVRVVYGDSGVDELIKELMGC